MSEGADLVERTAVGDQAEARHPAITRLEADDAAQARGLANRAAGIGAQAKRSFTGRHRRRRAAAGAAGDAFEVPRIASHLKRAILGRRTHGEFVHVRFAKQDGIRLLEAGDDVGVVGRYKALEHFAAAGRRLSGDAQHILEGDRQPRERPNLFAAATFLIDDSGLNKGVFVVNVQEGGGCHRPGGGWRRDACVNSAAKIA